MSSYMLRPNPSQAAKDPRGSLAGCELPRWHSTVRLHLRRRQFRRADPEWQTAQKRAKLDSVRTQEIYTYRDPGHRPGGALRADAFADSAAVEW